MLINLSKDELLTTITTLQYQRLDYVDKESFIKGNVDEQVPQKDLSEEDKEYFFKMTELLKKLTGLLEVCECGGKNN
tara:strand:+ start:285 stop:515 length:231 start_codon:yes stop_codon:yes gene_type:complete